MPQHHPQPRDRTRGDQRSGEVLAFLTRLSEALTAGDGAAAAKLWEVPAFVIGSGMTKPLADATEIAIFFAGAREQYNARGITDTKPEILSEDWIADDLVNVHVRCPYLDEQGREIGAEASDYTISRDQAGNLRLRVAIMRGVEGAKQGKPS